LIPWEIVRANPQFPWHYELLSGNRNITWEIVRANPQIPWNYHVLSGNNENISFDIVEQNPQIRWNYERLSSNSMKQAKDKFIQSRIRIKQHFLEHVCPEIENHCLHPDNFFNLYELGHHENQYNL
jgi:hypothetical protein